MVLDSLKSNLKLLSKVFDHPIANQCGNDGDDEIRDSEDVSNREDQALAVSAIRPRKLSHQEIGIEQENYESDLDRGSPHRREPASHLPPPERAQTNRFIKS
jgi:hypothetical protein